MLLDIQPSKSVGHFALGLPVRDVLKFISKSRADIPRAEFKFCKPDPLRHDLILNLVENGIHMRFDPVSQKLKFVELQDLQRQTLSYQETVFSDRNKRVFPTFLQIYNTFGPTYPGEFDSAQGLYTLNYPGISFIFPIPQQYASLYEEKSEKAQLPLEFPDGTTPVCTRFCVFQGKSASQALVAPVLSDRFRSLRFYYEVVTAREHIGIVFEKRKVRLLFGTNCQDVIGDIGHPNAIFFKKDHKMLIHSSSMDLLDDGDSQDYFYNYFDLGVDILFDGLTHKAKRFVLHSNLPGHIDFNSYRKCNFRIILDKDKTSSTQAEAQELDPSSIVPCDAKWDEIQQKVASKPESKGKEVEPVIGNRGSVSNPFGPSRFYGFGGLIFEITENNHLASLILFSNVR